MGVAADQYGNVFIADRNNQIHPQGRQRARTTASRGNSADCRDAHVRLNTLWRRYQHKLYQPSGVAVAQDGRYSSPTPSATS